LAQVFNGLCQFYDILQFQINKTHETHWLFFNPYFFLVKMTVIMLPLAQR